MLYSYSIDKKHSLSEPPLQRSESYPIVPVPQQGAVGPQAQAQAGASAACPAAPAAAAAALGSYRIIDEKEVSSPVVLREIQILNHNRKAINEFKEYLRSTSLCTFTNHGISWQSDDDAEPFPTSKSVGYIHRWTPVYRRAVIAKMYLLEKWHNQNSYLPVTMGTFTTYQDNPNSPVGSRTIESAFTCLKQSWKYLSMWLRYHVPDLQFVYFFEPHPSSGYPHLHVMFFGELSPEIQEKIKHLWHEKYHAGSYEHGVDFRPIKELKSVRNYIIKYVSKILHHADTATWTTPELVFNAVMWKHGWRLWGASRSLSQVMKKPVLTIDADEAGLDPERIMAHNYVWTHTTMTDMNGDIHLVRKKENIEIIDFNFKVEV
jgi:hypothetical protein